MKNDIIDNLDIEYKIVLNRALKNAIQIFSDNLLNLTLGGSGGKGNIIKNWSDLDIYVLLKKYDILKVVEFMKSIEEFRIHVGTTFYTINEVKNNFLDVKTFIMCYEKQNYNVNPTLYGQDVFNTINHEELIEMEYKNFPNVLHDFRRRYIEALKSNKIEKTYIKKLLILVKKILNVHYGIFIYGYKDSFDELNRILKFDEKLTEMESFDIMKVIDNMEGNKDKILSYSEFLLKYIEKNVDRKEERKWEKELVLGR